MADDESSSENEISSNSSSSEEEKGPPPTPPKQPRRAINFFIQAKFAETKRELGPQRRSSDIFRVLSEKWIQTRPDGREPYEIKAAQDMERYENERDIYLDLYRGWSDGLIKKPPVRKIKKKPDAPRRPKSAFKFFTDSIWEDVLTRARDLKDARSRCRVRWRKLKPKKRRPFQKLQAADMKRYRKEMAAVMEARKEERKKILRKYGLIPPEDEDEDEEGEKEEKKNEQPPAKNPRILRFCRLQ